MGYREESGSLARLGRPNDIHITNGGGETAMPLLFSTLSRGPTAKLPLFGCPHHAASFYEQLPQLSPFSHVQIPVHSMLLLPPAAAALLVAASARQQAAQRPIELEEKYQLIPTKHTVFSYLDLSWTDSQHSAPGKLSAPHHHQHHLGVATRPRFLVYLNLAEATRHYLHSTWKLSPSAHQEWEG